MYTIHLCIQFVFQGLRMAQLKLSDKAYEQIQKLIQEGRFQPGEPLQENELSEILQMSRTPIREALQRLEDDMVVTIKPRIGAFVATVDFAQLCNLYETREALDGMIANLLCKSSVPVKPFVELKQEFERISAIEDMEQRYEELHVASRQYDTMFRDYCGNPMLAKLSCSIAVKIYSLGNITKEIPFFHDQNITERTSVLDAVVQKDAVRAEALAREHVRLCLHRILNSRMNASV